MKVIKIKIMFTICTQWKIEIYRFPHRRGKREGMYIHVEDTWVLVASNMSGYFWDHILHLSENHPLNVVW